MIEPINLRMCRCLSIPLRLLSELFCKVVCVVIRPCFHRILEGEISIHGRNGQEISPENRCDSRNMFSRWKKAHFENKEEARQWNPALSEADRQCGLAGGEFADLQLSLLQNAMLFAGIVTLVQLVFGGSGIVPAALVAILLNIILPKEKEA